MLAALLFALCARRPARPTTCASNDLRVNELRVACIDTRRIFKTRHRNPNAKSPAISDGAFRLSSLDLLSPTHSCKFGSRLWRTTGRVGFRRSLYVPCFRERNLRSRRQESWRLHTSRLAESGSQRLRRQTTATGHIAIDLEPVRIGTDRTAIGHQLDRTAMWRQSNLGRTSGWLLRWSASTRPVVVGRS